MITTMFSNWASAPLLCARWRDSAMRPPLPFKLKAIPLVLSGVDLLARAQTGTGKTAAFGLPMIDRL